MNNIVIDKSCIGRDATTEYLLPMANKINEQLKVDGSITLSYDPSEDFSHIVFNAGGRHFDVRFYKVWSVDIDGQHYWMGCPRYESWAFANYLRDQATKMTIE